MHFLPDNVSLNITRHARERYVERTNPKFRRLKNQKNQIDKDTVHLIYSLHDKVNRQRKEIEEKIKLRLSNAKEERSYINDSVFMDDLYERHGYEDRIRFFVDNDITFVIKEKPGEWVLVTCIHSEGHIAGRAANKRQKRKYKKFCNSV